MKNRFTRLLFWAAMMAGLLMPKTVHAGNEYLQQFENYSVMSMGGNVLRFEIPVWVYGSGGNTYYLNPHTANNDNKRDSYLWFSEKKGDKRGSSTAHRIVSFGATRHSNIDELKAGGRGYVYALVGDGAGAIKITNTYNGVPLTLLPGDKSHWIIDDSDNKSKKNRIEIKRKNTTESKYSVVMIMDWYIPESLQGKTFYVGLNVCDYWCGMNAENKNFWWQWPDLFSADNVQSPELFDPYFYAETADGSSPKGVAGIPYVVYQDVKRYSLSLNPSVSETVSQRNGTVKVDMHDTIRTTYATFTVIPDKAVPDMTQDLRSNRVIIPAYHKIYNFGASEDTDEQGSITGSVTLRWNTLFPSAEDVIPSDIFEIQRATKPDFSDAQSIGMDALSETKSDYVYVDESENLRRVLNNDSLSAKAIYSEVPVVLPDSLEPQDGSITARMESNIVSPGGAIYYRIRRGSAAIWGWDESDWMKTTTVMKHDYLAPLAEVQQDYTLAPDFEESRKVNFVFKLSNDSIVAGLDPKEDLTVSYSASQLPSHLPIKSRITIRWDSNSIPTSTEWDGLSAAQNRGNRYENVPLKVVENTSNSRTYEATVYEGAQVELTLVAGTDSQSSIVTFDPKTNVEVSLKKEKRLVSQMMYKTVWILNVTKTTPIELKTIIAPYIDEEALRTTLYNALSADIQSGYYGRCSWDKSARLVLVRTIVETGEKMEFTIPNDSIKRQADGSWLVHFSNEASRSCVHYQYAVRLDQTNSTLHVQYPSAQLAPIAISGPDLYRNEGGRIAQMEAEGDKRGVLVQWQPTAGSIDFYTLWRREKGAADFDSLSTQTIEGYYDQDAEPGVTYEYKVRSSYTCHGTTTTNTATTEGTRLPFGSIAGRVQYEDGTGCYHIEVVLEDMAGNKRSAFTDEAGAFLFDSIYYSNGEGRQTTYTVTPVAVRAQFRFNNTSSPTATITLNKNNCEVENLYFDNISSVRFSGRVLYQNSTVPVRDANILLNGKLVMQSGEPYKTDVSGNFQILVPKEDPFTLQIIKDGHTFEGDGYVRMINEVTQQQDSLLTLTEEQPGVRIWDVTKVRLTGRVVGGLDQAALPLGHGLSKNNIGSDIQLVLELEGDNISWIVRDPKDLTRDTLEFTVQHEVFNLNDGTIDTVGVTQVHYQKKRIVIDVDPVTGEYCADLFPTKYKIVQATARGYATLFAQGKTGETVDLSNAPQHREMVTYEDKVAESNAHFSVTYRSPIVVTYQQYRYGLGYDYYGEKSYLTKNIANEDVRIDLVKQDPVTGEWNYLFGAPVFPLGQYQLRVNAHEDYYFNNDRANKPDVVNIKSGKLKVYNGMQETTSIQEYLLDQNGSALVDFTANHVTYVQDGDMALRQLDFSVESEGEYIEAEPLRAYILGSIEKQCDFLELDTVSAGLTLLDVLRDPPGSNSYATLAKGTKYHVKYKTYKNYRFGLDLILKEGNSNQYYIGTVAAPAGAGTAAGVINMVEQTKDWHMPFSFQYYNETMSEYEITTTETISTSSDPLYVGTKADVFIGATNGVMTSRALSFRVVDSLSYEMLAAQREDGTALVVAQGTDEKGSPWYLMRTEDVMVKHNLQSFFAYTQEYIINTVIPELFDYRDGLLIVGDSLDAVAAANKSGKYIFWSRVAPTDTTFAKKGTYEIITAQNYKGVTIDKVDAANKAILKWLAVIAQNEAIKVISYTTDPFSTLSLSGGVTQTFTENYAYSDYLRDYWQWTSPLTMLGIGGRNSGKEQPDGMGGFAIAWAKEMIWNRWYKGMEYTQKMQDLISNTTTGQDGDYTYAPSTYIEMNAGGAKFDFDINPITEFGDELIPDGSITTGESKSQTAVFAPNAKEHLTVQIFKSWVDDFNQRAEASRLFANQTGSSTVTLPVDPLDWWTPADPREAAQIYGSFVYRTLGGATVCPWEGGDSTIVFYTGTPLNYPTLKIENPQIVIDKHELSNIPHDGEGYLTIQMWNEIEEDHGLAAGATGIPFTLKLDENTNPKGLEIIIDGQPLTDGRKFVFVGSNVITKTVKVRAAMDYDYEDICLILESQCTPLSTNNKACFSVHFMPVSSPVHISTPSDKWIMNTLSPKDEQGYYMPVSIDGFDVNYDNFDHIELQYKLTTHSNDAWVNLCSYYQEDSLYQLASGTKRMIENGKIENFRFYGERDPMEQQYDLRAVSFCRHGSGFITRSSDVLTGIKDTRNPRVFGTPEPADAILGVGDHLKLRFNEAIAGNYLDEDNNFQVTGYTNESGITTGISLHFDGTDNSYAQSKVQRAVSNKSFSIDMLVRPTNPNAAGTFFTYEAQEGTLTFGMTADNRLVASNRGHSLYSLPMTDKMTAFTRVIFIYDYENNEPHFFAGTKEITDTTVVLPDTKVNFSASAPICVGKGFDGNIMEVRLWTKALTTHEIATTHLLRLTGYERELVAYYPMNEGKGETLTDKANGATLFTQGTAWEHQKGISLHISNGQQVILDGNLMSRSTAQDETLMMWFKTASKNGHIFSASWKAATDSTQALGTLLAVEEGSLALHSGDNQWTIANAIADGDWHHFVLTANRTYNNVSVYIDDKMMQTFDATQLGEVSGSMFLGGQGFEGNIDEFIIYEQALPQSLMTTFGTLSPRGDEMGLMAYLPFQEMKENDNGILEQVFSINDQRVFKTSEGDVVNKVQPLITGVIGGSDMNTLADMTQSAPVENIGQLTKMNFDWAFNNDELMININMRDRQINKQTLYITVRDVEDLNGNPMVSPVTWTTFVDKNALKWAKREVNVKATYGDIDEVTRNIRIINHSGKRHQYTIESLPDWMSVDEASGSIDPTDEITLTLSFNPDIAPGVYTDVLYLTDEDELSESLRIEFTVEAIPPYDDIDKGKYPLNMSVCGQVKIDEAYDTDENDIVYAIYRNECIGMANIEFDNIANTSKVFLTVHGSEAMKDKSVSFQLWQASTGKLLNLTPSVDIKFAHGNVHGCGDGNPVIFTTSGSEMQNIDLVTGWNWISTNLSVKSSITTLRSSDPWREGDLIKNPNTQQFSTYSEVMDQFLGTLKAWDYTQMYMFYTAKSNTLRLGGDNLAEADKHITIHGDGQWSAFPCLYEQTTPVAEALADYYDHASAGDILKAHDRFAVFSTDKRWEGDLKTLRPGEGYLFRRLAQGDVTVHFYNQTPSAAPQKAPAFQGKAATNMTMIAKIEPSAVSHQPSELRAYIGDELVGIATQIDSLYFLTISSDAAGTLRFETEDGTPLTAEQPISYIADAHHGTLKTPIILKPDDNRPYKIIENDHIVIIRNNERYDVTGKKLQ